MDIASEMRRISQDVKSTFGERVATVEFFNELLASGIDDHGQCHRLWHALIRLGAYKESVEQVIVITTTTQGPSTK